MKKIAIIGHGGAGEISYDKINSIMVNDIYTNDKILSDIENILERNLLGRDEDSETVEKIIDLFKKSNRPQLKWHFK